jgi:hypothetical protein
VCKHEECIRAAVTVQNRLEKHTSPSVWLLLRCWWPRGDRQIKGTKEAKVS